MEGKIYQFSHWGSHVNDILAPILDERLEEKKTVDVEETKKIEEFFVTAEDFPVLTDDSD